MNAALGAIIIIFFLSKNHHLGEFLNPLHGPLPLVVRGLGMQLLPGLPVEHVAGELELLPSLLQQLLHLSTINFNLQSCNIRLRFDSQLPLVDDVLGVLAIGSVLRHLLQDPQDLGVHGVQQLVGVAHHVQAGDGRGLFQCTRHDVLNLVRLTNKDLLESSNSKTW